MNSVHQISRSPTVRTGTICPGQRGLGWSVTIMVINGPVGVDAYNGVYQEESVAPFRRAVGRKRQIILRDGMRRPASQWETSLDRLRVRETVSIAFKAL
jgi:hypothetical protein